MILSCMLGNRRRRGRGARDESGQAIVLGVFTLFILALMLMMSFNVSQAIHERIRIQQHADAVAYSKAVVQARAFNYFAYTNRTMAAGYAAMATLHAYMSSASVKGEMLHAARTNLMIIGVLEIALCCTCGWPWPCCRINHCRHAIQAFRDARTYRRARDDYRSRVRELEEDFQAAVGHLNRLINLMHASQLTMVTHTFNTVARANSRLVRELRSTSAPESTTSAAVAAFNGISLMCAMDTGLSLNCGERTSARTEDKQQLMSGVAHGTRARFTANRSGWPLHLHPMFMADLLSGEYQPRGDGFSLPIRYQGTAKLTDQRSWSQLTDGRDHHGAVMGAEDRGMMLTQHRCLVWPFGSFRAHVYTDADGGSHRHSRSHTGEHDQFAGVHTEDSPDCGTGTAQALISGVAGSTLPNCFVKFRADFNEFEDGIGGAAHHFGQPPVYAAVRQDLRVFEDGQRGPWDDQIGRDGTVEVDHGSQGEAELVLGTEEEGLAVSKALVYYHRPKDWREQPNFFNPYWRAKLHPFEGPREYASVVGGASPARAVDAGLIWTAIQSVPPWN